jgi:hypothetical protein
LTTPQIMPGTVVHPDTLAPIAERRVPRYGHERPAVVFSIENGVHGAEVGIYDTYPIREEIVKARRSGHITKAEQDEYIARLVVVEKREKPAGEPEHRRLQSSYLFGDKPGDSTTFDLLYHADDRGRLYDTVSLLVRQHNKNPIWLRGMDVSNLDQLMLHLAYMRNHLAGQHDADEHAGLWERVQKKHTAPRDRPAVTTTAKEVPDADAL